MRIRKNKKLTASIIWSTAASSSSPNPPEELLQAHVCVVNRSPWDAPPSPPPPLDYPHYQAIETDNDSYGINGSLACYDSLPADNSHRSIDSMKISSKSTSIIPHSIESGAAQNSPAVANAAAMEADDQPPKRRRGRPRKVPAAQPAPPVLPRSTPSNPEFYYYSGFGPRWGKRRGADEDDDQKAVYSKKNTTKAAVDRKSNNNNNNAGGRSCSSSSCSRSLMEETDDELDFIDDDDDDDDDDNGGRKRMRKPVKARSLKSLIM